VIVKSQEQNQSFWLLGLLEQLTAEKDGVAQGAKLRVTLSNVKRPVQLLYPLELSCDESNNQETAVTLNPDAAGFRPRCDAAAAAELRVKDIVEAELN